MTSGKLNDVLAELTEVRGLLREAKRDSSSFITPVRYTLYEADAKIAHVIAVLEDRSEADIQDALRFGKTI